MPPEFIRRLRRFARRDRWDAERAREFEAHLRIETEENLARGMSPEDARDAAHRKFGNVTQVREEIYRLNSLGRLELLWDDLRHAARLLRRSPGFTASAVLTLMFGIGAPTTIFSVMNAVMLRPLPFRDSDELVRINAIKNGAHVGSPSPLDIRDYAAANHTFQQMVAYDVWRKNVNLDVASAEPEQMAVGLVPAGYFQVLGVAPMMGRLFNEGENEPGRNFVAIIDASLWRARFSADPAILGRKIRINDELYTVIAVLPDAIPSWTESRRIDIWTPFAFDQIWTEASRGKQDYAALGRLKPGVTLEQAQADLAAIAERLAAAHPLDRGITLAVRPLADTRIGTLGPALRLLVGAVSLILLIACANLANLLLARNASRRREFAVRAALGAGRAGLVRRLLAEALLLSLLGCLAGLAFAELGRTVLTQSHLTNLVQLETVDVDSRVLAFALLASLGTTILFGLGPALSATRFDLISSLKEGGRPGALAPRHQRMRRALVSAEIGLCLMLLVSAVLLLQSMFRLQAQELGIRQDHLLKGHFYVPPVRYPDAGAITRFCDTFGDQVRSVPGVADASVTTIYPPRERWTQPLVIPGRPAQRIEDVPYTRFGVADAHLLRTLGIPLLRGRDFAESDTAASAPVALITNEFSRRYFSDRNPIGAQIHIGPPPGVVNVSPGSTIWDSSDVEIIGVIGDIRTDGLAAPPDPLIAVLYSQHPIVNYGFKDVVIRTSVEPHSVVPEIRRRLHELDSGMPFAEVQTIEELISDQTSSQRLTSFLLALFAGMGLALAVVGIYGVVSYLVAQRARELAVRLALGATPAEILRLVVREGLNMALLGGALGILGAWCARQLTSGMLFGISPLDPLTLASVTAFLMAVTAAASYLPAARAARLDPTEALRAE